MIGDTNNNFFFALQKKNIKVSTPKDHFPNDCLCLRYTNFFSRYNFHIGDIERVAMAFATISRFTNLTSSEILQL